LGPVACLLTCTIGGFACANKKAMVVGKGVAPPAESPHVELLGARVAEGIGKDKVWDLAANTITYREGPKTADLQIVQATFFRDGQPVSHGLARAAQLKADEHRFTLIGGVEVVTANKQTGFHSNGAAWEPLTGRLTATGPVSFWRPAAHLSAANLQANRELSRVSLSGGVRGSLDLASDGTFPPQAAYNTKTRSREVTP
jgi:LPS export ABC transporter protein LptC